MRLSARVKALASLMSTVGTPRRPASGRPNSRPFQAAGRLGRNRVRPDASSNSPGTPAPAAATGPCSAGSPAPAPARPQGRPPGGGREPARRRGGGGGGGGGGGPGGAPPGRVGG